MESFIDYNEKVLSELEHLKFDQTANMMINSGYYTEESMALVMHDITVRSYDTGFSPKQTAIIIKTALSIVIVEMTKYEVKH